MAATGPPPKTKKAKNGLRFLIVDEDAYYADQLKQRIKAACGQHSNVHVVGGVEDALKKLDEQNYDLCFLDFGLADKAGLHTDAISRLSHILTAMIFMSDKPHKESALRALNVGGKDFLIKSNVSDFDVAKSISYALFWKYREIEMEAHAVHDQVTGLGNVPLFDEHLRHALEVAKRGKEKVGLLMIGLDGMEPVQEDYGDEVSDALLKQVGERIASKVRSTDVVSRLSNDQFGTILVKVASPSVVDTISGTLKGVISDKPYNINGYALKIGATIGASTYPDQAKNLDDMKGLAKKLLSDKRAKLVVKAKYQPYDYY